MELRFKTENSSNYLNASEEGKDQTIKHGLSKFELDLYKEEDDISLKAIRVKRFVMPNKDEKWKIFEDAKVLLVIEGTKLTKKEKMFLRTVDGFNFLISQYKSGNCSLVGVKKEIKKMLEK